MIAHAATSASSDSSATQALIDQVRAAQKDTAVGESRQVATINGFALSVAHRSNGFVIKAGRKDVNIKPRSACTYAVASAVYALGAAALTAAAATGGLEIAGVVLAPEILENLAAISGSFSAVYNFIAANVC